MYEIVPDWFRVRRFAGSSVHSGPLALLRVAHLTDLHVGRVTPMAVQWAAVELTNREHPDLVAITGDFVAHSQRYLEELGVVIRGFAAPVVCVLGNHDHWAGAEEVRAALVRAGAEVLSNAHTTITVKGQRLQLVGLDDAYTGQASLERAVRGLRPDLPSLGLSHIAEEADGLWQAGIPLVLSGHTHAGQVTVARLHELALGKLAGHRYVHGLYGTRWPDHAGAGAVYVGAGIGAAVVPFRMGERSRREVAVFDLGRVPGSFVESDAEQQPFRGRAPGLRLQQRRAAAVVRKERRRDRSGAPPTLASRATIHMDGLTGSI
jgi:uncharacterized protein